MEKPPFSDSPSPPKKVEYLGHVINIIHNFHMDRSEKSQKKTKLSVSSSKSKKIKKNKSTVKTHQYLTSSGILQHNRRLISVAEISDKLKKEFEDAQKHLNECHSPPINWKYARASKCKEFYTSERIGNVGIAHMQGVRPTMEDTHIATTLFINVKNVPHQIPLYGIFDGHGGDGCAKYLEKNLPSYLKTQFEKALANTSTTEEEEAAIVNVLKITFVELGAEYRKSHSGQGGSTANIAIIFKNTIYVANVGDTRCILIKNGKAIALSEDAKPALEKYKRGVENRHCVVLEINGIARVGGNLATARAVGHNEITSGLSPRAKIIKYSLNQLPPKGNHFLLIACDGLWDVASSKQVAQTIKNIAKQTPEKIATYLICKAYEAKSLDNLSALVVFLSPTNNFHSSKAS